MGNVNMIDNVTFLNTQNDKTEEIDVKKDTLNVSYTILQHCFENKTGTILISTINNRSCQIILEKGLIVAASFSRSKGVRALIELDSIGAKGESFIERLLPFTDEARIDLSHEDIEHLSKNNVLISEIQEFLKSKEPENNLSLREAFDKAHEEFDKENQPAIGKNTKEKKSKTDNTGKKIVGMYRGNPIYE